MADWAGNFGDDYTVRNGELPWRDKFWSKVLPKDITTVHEIGCNIGANLEAIRRVRPKLHATGEDINANAVKLARERLLAVHGSDSRPQTRADIVFTVGVLIHLRTPELINMMGQMRITTFRYVLFAEYFNDYDVEVPYRGERGALYKRDFGKIYHALYPDQELVASGFAGKDLGFDNTHWWLYDVSNNSG
jgi:pseudaminic acid biosynthesis-associated methylase